MIGTMFTASTLVTPLGASFAISIFAIIVGSFVLLALALATRRALR
jgi:hypothetical protein